MTTPPLDLPALREYAKELERDGARSGTIRTDVLRALLDRVEEADGLLARLSASGGRNIDLLTRAEAAEKKVAAVRGLTDHYAALADSMPKPHGTVTRTQAIFVRDIHQALDTHTPETETT